MVHGSGIKLCEQHNTNVSIPFNLQLSQWNFPNPKSVLFFPKNAYRSNARDHPFVFSQIVLNQYLLENSNDEKMYSVFVPFSVKQPDRGSHVGQNKSSILIIKPPVFVLFLLLKIFKQ